MKYLKMLGLAAIAAGALMAFVGASTASATVLCETNVTSNCGAGWEWATGHELDFSLKPGTSAKLTDPIFGITIDTCTGSTIKGNITQGDATHTVKGAVAAANLTWSGCSTGTTTVTPGELEIHSIAGSDQGTVTATGFTVTLENVFGEMCSYSPPTDLGNFVPSANGEDGELAINKVVNLDPAHSEANCPSTGKWVATYTQTTATKAYVSAS